MAQGQLFTLKAASYKLLASSCKLQAASRKFSVVRP